METIISLKSVGKTLFNDSVDPANLTVNGKIAFNGTDNSMKIDSGHVDLNVLLDLDSMQSFTFKAIITPDKVTGSRQS
ncbi:MAG: hypothetical protein EOO85_32920, partial [Pedobacter sp.]